MWNVMFGVGIILLIIYTVVNIAESIDTSNINNLRYGITICIGYIILIGIILVGGYYSIYPPVVATTYNISVEDNIRKLVKCKKIALNKPICETVAVQILQVPTSIQNPKWVLLKDINATQITDDNLKKILSSQ